MSRLLSQYTTRISTWTLALLIHRRKITCKTLLHCSVPVGSYLPLLYPLFLNLPWLLLLQLVISYVSTQETPRKAHVAFRCRRFAVAPLLKCNFCVVSFRNLISAPAAKKSKLIHAAAASHISGRSDCIVYTKIIKWHCKYSLLL